AREIAARYPDSLVAAAHRCGPLDIGESALACAVSAPHRKQAFAACDDLADTVKQRLPIWKHQVFDDGGSEWVGAPGCRPRVRHSDTRAADRVPIRVLHLRATHLY